MKKRLLAMLLTLCMVLTLLPATALAVEEQPVGQTPVVCAQLDGCTAETHREGCPLYVASADDPEPVAATATETTPVPAEPVCECGAAANAEGAIVHENTCPLYQAPVEQPAEEPKPVVQMIPAESGARIDPAAMSGTCGATGNEASVTWALTQNNPGSEAPTYTLTLMGTGAMADYTTKGTPWYSKRTAITQIILTEGLTSIGESAFLQTNITDITIPSTVTSIGTIAFWNCNTIRTEIPAAVTEIGATAFYGDFTLTVNEGNQAYLAENNVLYNKDKTKLVQVSRLINQFTIPSTVTEICEFAMNGCKLLTGTLTIPDSVTTVGNGAFGGTGYTALVLSKTMTKIGDGMFSGLPLSGELIIPDTITEIGANAFAKCTNLTEINIPEQVTSIGYAAFSFNTGVTKITVPLGNITYGKSAEGKSYIFSMCNIEENKVAVSGNLKTVVIGSTPENVDVYTLFSNSWKGLETLVLGSGVGELDVWNLSDSDKLSKVLYPSTLTPTRSDVNFTNVATEYTLATETSLLVGDTLPMLGFEKQAPTGITYTSSDPEIVSVDVSGNMKALQLTNEPVTISASYEDCVFTKLTLTVLKDASSADISDVNNAYPYTGEEVKPVPTVKLGDTELTLGTDYTLGYSDNTVAGTATITVTFKGSYTGTATKTFTINPNALTITADGYTCAYDGQPHGISVTAKEKDVTVKYSTTASNYAETALTYTNVGTYTVYYEVSKDNHTTVTGSQIVTITPAPLTITAKSYYIYVGGTAPTTYEYTVTGWQGSDSTFNTAPTVTCPTANASTAGTYPITASGANAGGNYTIAYVPGSLTVSNYSSDSVSGSGDSVRVWVYGGSVTAAQMERAVGRADKGATIDIKATGSTDATLPLSGLNAAANNGNTLAVTTRNGEIALSAEALKGLTEGAVSGGKATVGISAASAADAGVPTGTPVFGVSVSVGGQAVHSFDGALDITLTVSNLSKIENPYVLHVLNDGTKQYLKPTISGNQLTVSGVTNLSYFAVIPGSAVPEKLPFTDVSQRDYFYAAVLWAVGKDITGGTSATTFGPNLLCTRAQAVTFLWRAAGSPAATGNNPFTDVDSGAYYHNAVLWAVEKGITGGTSATTFAPDATCTRGQIATFLYRYAGSPTVLTGNPFTDVAVDDYCANAVAWAAAENITSGTSATTFAPGADCTRGQIVTFLYRHMGK